MQQRGQEDRDKIFLRAYGIDEVVMDIQKSRFNWVNEIDGSRTVSGSEFQREVPE